MIPDPDEPHPTRGGKGSDTTACSPIASKIRLKCWVDGDRYGIECPKGLWAVEGAELIEVIREAMHYYRQYEADGEYLSMPLPPGTPDAGNVIGKEEGCETRPTSDTGGSIPPAAPFPENDKAEASRGEQL